MSWGFRTDRFHDWAPELGGPSPPVGGGRALGVELGGRVV